MKLVHWTLTGGMLHLVYSEEGTGWGSQPAQAPPRCTKRNSHSSTASVPIDVLLYRPNGPLLCGFNVAIKD